MLDILIIVVAVALILLSLLQSGKSDGISGAFTGNGGLNLFQNVKERGPEKVIADLTLVLGVAFFALIVLNRVLS
ncbi:MAG: preprotein translocase subunit SecG [Erysipelotrichaceae bacterium]|nr:preprotein translocase subunit SecG [Erysipelotrichaceae bacterium]